MDKNTITGFVLMALVLFGFAWWQTPSDEEIAQERVEFVKDSIAKAQKIAEQKQEASKAANKTNTANTDTTSLFYTATKGVAKDIVLQNSKIALTFNTKGGVVRKAIIKGYKGHNVASKDRKTDKNYVTLFDEADQNLNFILATKNQNIETQNLYFTPSNLTDSTLTLTAAAGNGKTLTLDYKLTKKLYVAFRCKGNRNEWFV